MNNQEALPIDQGITEISVQGFKSLYEESRIEIRPLTILAGANSSGKSSIMQPLLLMKQTLEAPFDPGGLLLSGASVRFTSSDQVLSLIKSNNNSKYSNIFSLKINIDTKFSSEILYPIASMEIKNTFGKNDDFGLSIFETSCFLRNYNSELIEQITYNLNSEKENIFTQINSIFQGLNLQNFKFNIHKKRQFLILECRKMTDYFTNAIYKYDDIFYSNSSNIDYASKLILALIYLPGLRGKPQRSYPISGVETFSGVFDDYFASIIYQWKMNQDSRIEELNKYLQNLGLTSKVTASRPNDIQIELQVGLSKDISDTVVNIADVGLGVSQVLPVLVALLVAESGQLVYLEQPELHLHPRAQANLAQPLIDAANRGVKVVVETHSDLLLTRIKTLVAEEAIDPAKLILHWFSRGDDGITKIDSKELDKVGAYGEFPIDFSDVFFEEDHRYIKAASKQLLAKNKK